MKKYSKIVTAVLALMLVISLFAGCSSDAESTTTTTTAKTTKAGDTTTKATTEGTQGPVRKLSLMGSVDQAMWDTKDDQASWKKYLEMLKAINVELDIEAIAIEQYATVLQTRTSSGDVPDLVMLNGMDTATIVNLGKAGVFQDVKPLVDEYSNGNWEIMADKFSLNYWGPVVDTEGKAYFLPGWMAMTGNGKPFFSLMVPLIRYDWLQKLGLPIPKTIDEFSADLKAFRDNDVNENGKADEVMLYTPGFQYFGTFFGLPCNNYQIDAGDDKVKSPWLMKDQLIPYILWLQDMVESGVLSTDAIGKPYDFTTTMIKNNQVSVQVGFALTGFYDLAVEEYNGSYLGVVTPKDPNNFYVTGAPGTSLYTQTAITKNIKDPEAAIDLFDMYNTEEFYTLHRFGVEGISHTVVDGRVMPVDGLSNRDFDLSGKACLATIAGSLIPGLRIEQFEQFYTNLGTDPALVDARKSLGLTYSTFSPGSQIYAIGDWGEYQQGILPDTDLNRKKDLKTDLDTYMNETITKYALGQYKIEDLDTYIQKMKDMGLEELMSIYQKGHDKFLGK